MKNEELRVKKWFIYIEGVLMSKASPCHLDPDSCTGERSKNAALGFITQRTTEKAQSYTEVEESSIASRVGI
jgi:hypothetical protein